MVLGAGLGSRLKPFTTILPKPLMPILGVPSIEYALLSLRDAGVTEVVINIHAHAEKMLHYIESNPVPGLHLKISDEQLQLLGSAGGFRKALPHFSDRPFVAMNADTLSLANLEELMKRHQELNQTREVWMTLVLAKGKALQGQEGAYREIFVDENTGLITGFGEKKKQIPFYAGVGVFDPRCFQHLPLDVPAEFVPQVLEPMIQQKKVGFMWSDALWMDLGSPELWWKSHFDLLRAQDNGLLPESWTRRLQLAKNTFHLDSKLGVVDYDDAHPLGKNYIQLEGIKYAIPSLGA